MALPITGGDQVPIVKYGAKSAKWKVDDVLLNTITMIVDMASTEIGWAKFTEGMAPEFVMVKASDFEAGRATFPPRPDMCDDKGRPFFRRAFKVTIKLSDKVAGGKASVREWASNCLATCKGFSDLDDLWQAQRADHVGQVPVAKMTGVETITGQFGDNFKPTFEIVRWVDRPADLKPNGAPVAQAAATTTSLDDPDDFADLDDDGDDF